MADKTGYRTQQREIIMGYLKEQGQVHVTVDQVSDFLREQGRKVGRTTVYRYMEKLAEQGMLRKYFIEEGMGACYEWVAESNTCKTHFHLKCVMCGKLFHVECEYLMKAEEHIRNDHDFYIDNRKTVMYGLCGVCKERGENSIYEKE